MRKMIVPLVLVLATPGWGGPAPRNPWLKLRSAHFEMFTTAGERSGRDTILYFEQVRELFGKLSSSGAKPSLPVRIVAFRSEKEYKPYATREFAPAYYLGSSDADYIVMRNLGAHTYPVALHEYIHLIIKHTGRPVPVWMNEGLADFYSTLKPIGNKVQIGDGHPGRLQVLRANKWLDLGTLIAAGQDSPFYSEKNRAGMFYAQSWLLVHMLNLHPEYRAWTGELLKSITAGTEAAAAFQKVYGKSLAQVAQDLREYLNSRLFVMVVDTKLEKSAEQPEIGPAVPLESGLVLADLLALTDKKVEAAAAYQQLASEYPQSPEVQVSWSRLALQDGDYNAMRRHLGRAVELGARSPRVYLDYASLLSQTGDRDPRIAVVLRKGLELDPGNVEAQLRLGFFYSRTDQFEEAVHMLAPIRQLTRENAFPYFHALAYACYRTGRKEEAWKHATRLRELAVTPDEIERAESLLSLVSRDPDAEIRRLTRSIEFK